MINPSIWIEMRVKSDEIVMKRFDKNKQQSLEYLGYDMEKAKKEHFNTNFSYSLDISIFNVYSNSDYAVVYYHLLSFHRAR